MKLSLSWQSQKTTYSLTLTFIIDWRAGKPPITLFFSVTNEGSREAGELFKRCFVAFFLVEHLRAAGFWDNSPPECHSPPDFFQREEVLSVVELALRHLQSCSCNAYEIGEMIEVCVQQLQATLRNMLCDTHTAQGNLSLECGKCIMTHWIPMHQFRYESYDS